MSWWNLLKARMGFAARKNPDARAFDRLVEAAVALLQSENYPEAQKVLLRAAEFENRIQSPEHLEWIFGWLWITWEHTEEYKAAIKFYSSAIARHPDNQSLYHLRGIAHWYEGSNGEALKDYSQSLERNPNDASALSGRGQVLVERGEFQKAVEDLNRALNGVDSIPGVGNTRKGELEAYARNGLAAAYAGLGEFDRALQEFRRSIELAPENAWVYFNRAEAYRSRGSKIEAAQDYKFALSNRKPRLTSLKREHALRMLAELTP